jgi:hypothetical protein
MLGSMQLQSSHQYTFFAAAVSDGAAEADAT